MHKSGRTTPSPNNQHSRRYYRRVERRRVDLPVAITTQKDCVARYGSITFAVSTCVSYFMWTLGPLPVSVDFRHGRWGSSAAQNI